MKKLTAPIKDIQFSERSVPWILLTACVLAFGLLIPQLGYFQDDWNYVINHYLFGSKGIFDFLNYDGRPVASWVFIAGFSVLGYKPLLWHIATLLLRWLTATVIWNILRFVWPDNRWQNMTAALIFVLYPFFTLQPLAVAYSMHWSGYLLFALSIYLMLLAQKKRFWTYTILALLTQVLHLFTLEFYAGIDLLRPAFLWLVMTNNPSTREKIKSISFKWFPYLIVFITFFIWRGFFYEAAAEGRNVPLLLTGLLTDPIPTLITTISNGIPDLVLILITSWYKLIEPTNFLLNDSANRYISFITLISFFIFLFFFTKQDYINKSEGSNPTTTAYFLIGAAALILGLIPAFTAGFVIHSKIEPWNSRFSLGPSLGAALIITSLIDYLIKVPRSRWIILSIIFGLLIGWHLRSTNNFRWAWQKQVNFYRQLYLRAPEISPGTAILAEEEVIGYMGDYPTSYGINSIYISKGNGFENSRSVDYWFYPLPEFSGKFYDYLAGEPFSDERAGIIFEGEEEGSIVITFAPEFNQCLWVIRPEYAVAKSLPQTTRLLASISYIDRIKEAPQNPDSFLLKYLYTNPVQDWCYYYQKADLAYQYEEWDEVIALWESANDSGLQPENGFEYLPFIEAYANRGDWQTAKKMTRTSQKTMQGIDPLLCNIWEKLDGNTTASTEKDDTILSVRENLKCDQP